MIGPHGVLEAHWLLLAALAFDLAFGEVPTRLHPVAWIGTLIAKAVKPLPREGVRALFVGAVLALGIPSALAIGTYGILDVAGRLPWLATLLELWLLTSSFSVRMLGREALRIGELLERGDVSGARARLSHLCSRDAGELTPSEIAGAAAESVAENTSDSYVAPLLWFCLLGVPGAVLFKVVNTMDAMIGYRGEFERLGKAAARLDDALCWIPARLTALIFLATGAAAGGSPRRGLGVLARDRRLTSSPNAGYPMAAFAGMFDVRLVKSGEYELGRDGRDPGPETVYASTRVLNLAAAAVTAMVIVLLGWIR